ncbi:PilZ domain-containing protein [Altererythrobacter aquiaggeris]|uniref:PilZ domain-containing protein n=1 Tax=Aestuarierythrobacter aquiaggeris TaxID=1898396 RepID=UPI003016A0B5
MTGSTLDNRKTERADVAVFARYRTGRGIQMRVRMLDLSEAGCKLYEKRTPLSPGDKISMRIEMLGMFDAKVIWVKTDLIGIRFEMPLYGPVFDHIRSTLSGKSV